LLLKARRIVLEEIPWDEIDVGIRPFVRLLNEEGIETFASCSGHGKRWPAITCKIKDDYEENDIINALLKHGYCGFSVKKIRYITSKTNPIKDDHHFCFWEIEFWDKDILENIKAIEEGDA